jgi:hypothetical protein
MEDTLGLIYVDKIYGFIYIYPKEFLKIKFKWIGIDTDDK